MNWQVQGIRQPSDSIYNDADIRKSNLLLEAKPLREQEQENDAARRFAEAARIEKELADYCDKNGYPDSARIHRYNSVCCWAGADNFY
jgi:hypothetical protein